MIQVWDSKVIYNLNAKCQSPIWLSTARYCTCTRTRTKHQELRSKVSLTHFRGSLEKPNIPKLIMVDHVP